MDCTAWEWRDKLLKCVLDEKLSAVEGASLCGDMVAKGKLGLDVRRSLYCNGTALFL